MFLSGNLHGVVLPPSLYNEFGWAYREQSDFLSEHPDGALIDTPLSNNVGLDLQTELARSVDEGVMAYFGLARLPRQSDEIQPMSGIRIEPTDVLHFIECFRRQAASLERVAAENSNTIGGFVAMAHADDKYRLVASLHAACMESRLQPVKLSFEYRANRKPVRPPIAVLPGKGKWHFSRPLSV